MTKKTDYTLPEVNTNNNLLNERINVYKFSPIYYNKYDYNPDLEEYYIASVDGELSLLDQLPKGVYRITKLK